MAHDDGGWFAGATGRNEREAAFLEQLGSEASAWNRDDTTPGSTEVFAGVTPLFVLLRVPGLTIPRRVLEVAFWTDGPWAAQAPGPVLHGAWSDTRLGDNHDGNDPECLTVIGVEAPPEQHATWAAQWMRHQLERPVVRDDWIRGERTVASRWVLDDTGLELHQEHGGRRLLSGRPNRRTRVR